MPNLKRCGECNHCGWCCDFEAVRRNVVQANDGETLHPSDRRFYELRGGVTVDNGRKILMVVHEYAPCSAYNKDCKRCKDYDNRPLTCQEFPSMPGQIEGTPCSFWFETEVNGEIVRRGGGGSPYATPVRFEET